MLEPHFIRKMGHVIATYAFSAPGLLWFLGTIDLLRVHNPIPNWVELCCVLALVIPCGLGGLVLLAMGIKLKSSLIFIEGLFSLFIAIGISFVVYAFVTF